ncbi:MAG: DJ-1/PfpI family protein, partial [Thermoanaerobaculia bacterium]
MRSRTLFSLLVLALAAGPAVAADSPYTKNVAVVIYEGVEVLDFAGPAEVLSVAGGYGSVGEERAFNVYTVSRSKKPIVSQGFIDVVPDYSIEESPRPDILVLPGGSSSAVTSDPEFLAWVEKAAKEAEYVLTVCTGAFIAGRAGLLDGAEATTWYNAVPRLASEFPETKVHEGRRFVDSGKIITTAGVSAGIDGSLHLVARLLGRVVADRTAEYMEYKWAPESYHSSKYTQLNPSVDDRGRAIQRGEIQLREGNAEEAVATFRGVLEANENDGAAWLALGRALHTLERYEEAIAAHARAAQSPTERGTALYNMACEYALLGEHEKAIEAVERAVDAGLRAKWSLQNDPELAAIRSDPRFQA